jgi:hypothetical protein
MWRTSKARHSSSFSGPAPLGPARLLFTLGKGWPATQDRNFISKHYAAIVVASYSLLMAMVIFFMAIPLSVQLLLLVVSTAVFAVAMGPEQPDDPPMGTSEDLEGIERPRPASEPPSRQAG